MKRTEFKTLDAARTHILALEAVIAKTSNSQKPDTGAKSLPAKADPAEKTPATLDEANRVIADLRAENATLRARIVELEKQLKDANKAQPKDPDEKDTFSKSGVTEASLAAAISTEKDYRKVWALQRALDAIQTARVNSAVYPKARK